MGKEIEYSEDTWHIYEKKFQPNYLAKFESIFSLGNGYLGSRAALEEKYTNETRDTFIAGTFDKFDASEVSELPNLPDIFQVDLELNDSKLDLNKGEIHNYCRSFNTKVGVLKRKFDWKINQSSIEFISTRFASFSKKHLLCSQMMIKNIGNSPIKLKLLAGIDGKVDNSGTQHLRDGDKRFFDSNILNYFTKTNQSNINISVSLKQVLKFENDSTEIKGRIVMPRRKIQQEFIVTILPGMKLVMTKYGAYFTSRDNDLAYKSKNDLINKSNAEVNVASANGFDSEKKLSINTWKNMVWNKIPIKIKTKNYMDNLALHFARYHLHAMTARDDPKVNIAAKGLTGEGYKGHTFWDTEMFILPYFIYSYPKIAKNLLKYRFLSLTSARQKAADNNYRGAEYPWESAWIQDKDCTPVWGDADIVTGKATKIWSGFIEQHITADVAYGIYQYLSATADIDFGKKYGYEIILDTARFWTSRVSWNKNKQKYEITDVIGPNEYKEHVDNNAFTNYMAYWNMCYAQKVIYILKTKYLSTYDYLDKRLDLIELNNMLDKIINSFYLPKPNKDNIIPENDTYLSKEIVDLTEYLNNSDVVALFKKYNLNQINQMQITKQSDVILLLNVLKNEFDTKVKLSNWDYYVPKTTHDSSLSMTTHMLVAEDLGKKAEAKQFYDKAKMIDLGENMHSSDEGVHAASLGGIWDMTIQGFGGVSITDAKLKINPNLPDNWEMLDFYINYHNQKIHIVENKSNIKLVKESKEKLQIVIKDKTYELESELKVGI